MSIPVRSAVLSDLETLAGVLSAAFDDDPLINYWVRQDRRRRQGLDVLMREMVLAPQIPVGTTYTNHGRSGVAVWVAPPGKHVTSADEWAEIRPLVSRMGGRRSGRFEYSIRLLEEHHPDTPHWYLFGIGVHPRAQGKGVGSALVRHVTERCDQEGVPAYLETQKEQNVPIYEHLGFRVTKRIQLARGGPQMRLMWRDPK